MSKIKIYINRQNNKGRDNMLFMPQEQAKKLIKKHLEEGKERRRIESEKRKEAYLKAEKEGKLDEYYAELREKRQFY